MEPRRAAAGFKEEETRGDTAERAVAPLEIEEAVGDDDAETEDDRLAVRGGAGVVVMIRRKAKKIQVFQRRSKCVSDARKCMQAVEQCRPGNGREEERCWTTWLDIPLPLAIIMSSGALLNEIPTETLQSV